MKNFINKELWVPKDEINLEKAASEVVKYEKNAAVLAGPGAGKTELLAQKACYLLETNICPDPSKILAISFKRDAAKNLKERVEERSGREFTDRFVSLTYDSFAKQLLDRFILAIPEPYRPTTGYEIVNFSRKRDVVKLRQEIGEPSQVFEGGKFFNYNDFAKSYANTKLPLKYEKIDSIQEWYQYHLWMKYINDGEVSQLTFPMISRIVEYLFRLNPKLLTAIQATYSHVFLDEFQDTTLVQYDLIQTLFQKSTVTVTAVGDIKQRIMGWAGAIPEIFKWYNQDFQTKEFEMVINHRSAPNLVRIQTSIVNDMVNNTTMVSPSDRWKDPNEGICETWSFNDVEREAQVLSGKIKKWIEDEGLEKRDICILVRQKADLYCEDLINALNDLGIHSRVEDKWQDLLTENFSPYIIDVFTLSTKERDSKAWSSLISAVQRLRGKNESESYEIEVELNNFINTFKDELNVHATDITKERVVELLYKILNAIGIDLIKNSFSEYRKGTYLERKVKQVAEFLFHSFEKHKCWRWALEDFLGIHSIPIMSIHKSKGLEFESVIVLGLEDEAFWNFKNKPKDETYTFFVALSRAKTRVIFTFCANRFSGQYRNEIRSIYQMLEKASVEEIKW